MTLLGALTYFIREALVNLVRGWKTSLVAILTIAVSLLLGGAFLLASRNLLESVERWRREMRIVVYLKPGTPDAVLVQLTADARQAPWVASAQAVTSAAARARFRETFPGMSDLVEGWEEEPLPPSIEVGLKDPGARRSEAQAWIEAWRQRAEVEMVDDDREWLGQLETLVALGRGIGLTLAGVLLGAAIFTTGSVIRLTAFLHQEEISILRLVGATEFYIRGPFYTEGLLQGLIGGGLATGGLYLLYQAAVARSTGSLAASVLTTGFLTPGQAALLVLLGGGAGLLGAIASLRRERLDTSEG
ncbi:MAG TPA: permease-like cell division protein FtsX [Thermoanaerobaculia bacterium]|jgi:cell division transport system permease protein|nr:permease-like cell division protein FtsX [Thermoanaerobaculia bacterium]